MSILLSLPICGLHDTQMKIGRALDSGARGPCVVSLSKIHLLPKRTGNTQEAVAPSRLD